MRRFQVFVRDENNLNPQTRFHFVNLGALFIEQVGRNLNGYLCMHGCAAFLHRFFLNHTEHMKCR